MATLELKNSILLDRKSLQDTRLFAMILKGMEERCELRNLVVVFWF
jgi:hypothetical protein